MNRRIGGLTPISDFGHVQVLVNIIDLGMGLREAIDAPRYRYRSGRAVLPEHEIPATVPATVVDG